MKSFLLILGALFAGSALGAQDYAVKEVLVKFRPNSTYAKNMSVYMIQGQVVQEFSFIGWTRIRYNSGYSVSAAVNYFKGFSEVQAAEPNYLRKPLFTPNDPMWNQQYGPRKIKADLAWNISQGTPSVVVAVLDTGVDLDHPDLMSKLVPGFDFSDNDNDPSDSNGHGTHCAGIVGAATNNGVGVAGTGFNVKVMPLKIFPNAFVSVVVAAVKHAADNGAKVVSMSFGGAPPSQAEQDAMNYALGKNVTLVAGAGNNGDEALFYPAAYPGIISVAATDSNDQMAGFSTHGDWVRVAAPGVNIMSTLINGYGNSSGTSMSCPMVAGVAALCYSQGGLTSTVTAVRNAIYNNCDFVGNFVHFGRVNALRAVQAMAPPIVADFVPSTILPYVGTNTGGTLASVLTSDNFTYNMLSAGSSLGQVAGVTSDILISHSMAEAMSIKMTIEARGATGGTMFVYLKNKNTGLFDHVKAFPTATTDKANTFDLAPTGPYIGPGNVVSMILRNTRSPRLSPNEPFTFGVDQIKITGTFRS